MDSFLLEKNWSDQSIVQQKTGRIKQRFPSIARHFDINCTLDSEKINVINIHWNQNAQIQENKPKEPKKQGKFQQKLQEVMEQAEAEKAKKGKK